MRKLLFSFVLAAVSAFGQYKMEPAGAPPSDVSPGIAAELQKTGMKVVDASGNTVSEIWLRSVIPTGPKANEESVTFPEVPMSALIGVMRFATQGADRRGQPIKPGVYTLRYSRYPLDGAHQGVALQRDFLLLSPAASDTDLNAKPSFEQLVNMSRKASGTQHPAVISIWKADMDYQAGFAKQGDTDWVWQTKVGDEPIAIVLIGQAQQN